MRKGAYGLSALVKRSGLPVFSGDLYVFLSRRADRVKILAYDRGGFVLWYKMLEKGRFKRPKITPQTSSITIDATQLMLLLEGIDFSQLRRPARWSPPHLDKEKAA